MTDITTTSQAPTSEGGAERAADLAASAKEQAANVASSATQQAVSVAAERGRPGQGGRRRSGRRGQGRPDRRPPAAARPGQRAVRQDRDADGRHRYPAAHHGRRGDTGVAKRHRRRRGRAGAGIVDPARRRWPRPHPRGRPPLGTKPARALPHRRCAGRLRRRTSRPQRRHRRPEAGRRSKRRIQRRRRSHSRGGRSGRRGHDPGGPPDASARRRGATTAAHAPRSGAVSWRALVERLHGSRFAIGRSHAAGRPRPVALRAVEPHDDRRGQARQHPDRAGQGGDQGRGRHAPARASAWWAAAGWPRALAYCSCRSPSPTGWPTPSTASAPGSSSSGLVYAAVAAVLVLKGKQQISSATPIAEQTIETIKEDVEWARRQRT